MKRLAKTSFKILATLLVVFATVHSSKSQSTDKKIVKTDTLKAGRGIHLLPAQIAVYGDSIAMIGFMQTAVPYYLDICKAEGKKKLEIFKRARKVLSLVYIHYVVNQGHVEITDVEHSPKELTIAFQKALHTGNGKPIVYEKP